MWKIQGMPQRMSSCSASSHLACEWCNESKGAGQLRLITPLPYPICCSLSMQTPYLEVCVVDKKCIFLYLVLHMKFSLLCSSYTKPYIYLLSSCIPYHQGPGCQFFWRRRIDDFELSYGFNWFDDFRILHILHCLLSHITLVFTGYFSGKFSPDDTKFCCCFTITVSRMHIFKPWCRCREFTLCFSTAAMYLFLFLLYILTSFSNRLNCNNVEESLLQPFLLDGNW